MKPQRIPARKRLRLLSSSAFAALVICAASHAAEPSAPGPGQVIFQNVCVHCHGAKGEGNAQIKAPAIAGLPDWHVLAQIENFRANHRGTHSKDAEGRLMHAISQVLNAGQARLVSEFVGQLPRQTHEPTIKADTAAGRRLYEERCMECHRFNGEGELVFGAAPLTGFQDWYLAAQLRKFKDGVRGALKEDANGQKMAAAAGYIEDDKVLDSLAAYIFSLSKEKEKPSPAAAFGK